MSEREYSFVSFFSQLFKNTFFPPGLFRKIYTPVKILLQILSSALVTAPSLSGLSISATKPAGQNTSAAKPVGQNISAAKPVGQNTSAAKPVGQNTRTIPDFTWQNSKNLGGQVFPIGGKQVEILKPRKSLLISNQIDPLDASGTVGTVTVSNTEDDLSFRQSK